MSLPGGLPPKDGADGHGKKTVDPSSSTLSITSFNRIETLSGGTPTYSDEHFIFPRRCNELLDVSDVVMHFERL
jgi:hypothetical protein